MARHKIKAAGTGVVLGLSLLVAGCFEIRNDMAFRENGEARVEVEVALAAEVMAILNNPAFAKEGKSGGLPDLLGECGKPWPSAKPLPDGVRAIESRRGKRGDMETCTMVIDVSDPVGAVEGAMKMDMPDVKEAPKRDFSLVRLDGGNGYRFRVGVTPAQSPEMPPEAAKMAAALMAAMLANRHFTLSLAGQRIENTNGELAPDRKQVTWKIPLASMADQTKAQPLVFEADVIYR